MNNNEPLSTADWIAHLNRARNQGYRITPLVGAGLSRPSGVPVIGEIKKYLAFCVWRSLAHALPMPRQWLDGTDGLGQCLELPLWDPRTNRWPDIADEAKLIQKALENIPDWKSPLKRRPDLAPSNFDPLRDPQLILYKLTKPGDELLNHDLREVFSVVQEAYGVLADWRQSLHFLSRIRFYTRPPDRKAYPALEEGVTSVIDSFFVRFISNREPCLGHRMLVAMADIFRIRVILTTNFDDLIEQAFDRAGRRLKTFEVPVGSPLPPVGLVMDQPRAVIKLHGGTHGLRADLTLDTNPDENAKQRFLGYLTGYETNRAMKAASFSESPETEGEIHSACPPVAGDRIGLIVAGVSAKDARTCRFVEYLWQTAKELRIFWVCHNDSDAEAVRKLNDRLIQLDISTRAPLSTRSITFTRCPDIGLLFLEINQHITGTVPASGIFFPCAWNFPLPPYFPIPDYKNRTGHPPLNQSWYPREILASRGIDLYPEKKAAWLAKISEILPCRIQGQPGPAVLQIESAHNVYGIPTICADLFWTNPWWSAHSTVGVWISLDGVPSPEDFFVHLIVAIARRAGTQEPVPDLDTQLFHKIKSDEISKFTRSGEVSESGAISNFVAEVISELRPFVRTQDVTWLVFVNCHAGMGTAWPDDDDLQLDRADFSSAPHVSKEWCDEEAKERFWAVVVALAMQHDIRVKFISMTEPNTMSRHNFSGRIEQTNLDLSAVWYHPEAVLRSVLPDELVNRLQPRLIEQSKPGPTDSGATCWLHAVKDEQVVRAVFLYSVLLNAVPHYRSSILAMWDNFRQMIGTGELGEIPGLKHSLVSSWTRIKVNERLRELQTQMIVLEKAGGFVWIDHTVRRTLLKHLENWIPEELGRLGARQDAFDSVCVRLHSFIARWYGRLFLGTADPLCVFETVRHAGKAIRRLERMTRPADGCDEADLELTFFIARHAGMVLQTMHPLLNRRVTERFAHKIIAQLQREWESLCDLTDSIVGSSAQGRKVAIAARLYDSVKEVYSRLVHAHITVLETSTDHTQSVELMRALKPKDSSNKIPGASGPQLADASGPSPGDTTPSRVSLASPERSQHLTDLEVLELNSRLAGAYANLRRYADAQLELDDVIQRCSLDPGEFIARSSGMQISPEKAARRWLVDHINAPEKVQALAHAIRSLFFLRIHQSQAIYLENSSVYDTAEPSERSSSVIEAKFALLKEALHYSRFAIELLRGDPVHSDDFVYYENSRLRSHVGLVQAHLAGMLGHSGSHDDSEAIPWCVLCKDGEKLWHNSLQLFDLPEKDFLRHFGELDTVRESRFDEAEVTLYDTRAFLEEFPRGGDTLSFGVLELRLAEVRLIRLSSDPWLVRARHQLRSENDPGRGRAPLMPAEQSWRLAGILRDALRTLDRAEYYLRQHRKNTWWWQIHITLWVKACEYGVVLEWACSRQRDGDTPLAQQPNHVHLFSMKTTEMISELVSLLPPEGSCDVFLTARQLQSVHRIANDLRKFAPGGGRESFPLDIKGVQVTRDGLWNRLKQLYEPRWNEEGLDPAIKKYVNYVLSRSTDNSIRHT